MSGRIVGEVLENAPTDLTPAQLLVLVSLAENAPTPTRIAAHHTSVANLERRTRLGPGTIRNALSELAKRGLIKPLFKARIGVVQHYYIEPLNEYHRHAITNPGGVRSVTHQ
jgi:Fe2+ or Zn2+ uptake regulation protein